MAGEASDSSAEVAAWPAGTVARHLGVAVSTLRSWSRRYGLEPTQHTPGRHRRYTTDDVARLEMMLRLVAGGMAPAQAARCVQAELPAPTDSGTDPTRDADPASEGNEVAQRELASRRVRGGLLAAAMRLDSDAITDALAGHLARWGVVNTWDAVCVPVLTELGVRNARAADCVDAEHLLSWAIGAALHRVPEPANDPGVRLVLLACAARERHTLALDALRAALAEHGTRSRMLGAATPTAALLSATTRIQPGAVVVWAHTAATAQTRPLARLTQTSAPQSSHGGPVDAPVVIAAGPGWDAARLPATVDHAQSLRTALLLTLGATRSASLPTG